MERPWICGGARRTKECARESEQNLLQKFFCKSMICATFRHFSAQTSLPLSRFACGLRQGSIDEVPKSVGGGEMTYKRTRVTRRTVLQTACAPFAAAGIAALCGERLVLPARRLELAQVQAETFLPYVGRTFQFQRASHTSPVRLKLLEVIQRHDISRIESENPSQYGQRQRKPFSLLFEQPEGDPVVTGLCRLTHADFENFELFLSSVGRPTQHGTTYVEAVFG